MQLCLLLWKSWKTFYRSWGWIIAQSVSCVIVWALAGYMLGKMRDIEDVVDSLDEMKTANMDDPHLHDLENFDDPGYHRHHDRDYYGHRYKRDSLEDYFNRSREGGRRTVRQIPPTHSSRPKRKPYYLTFGFVWKSIGPFLFPLFFFCIQASMEVTQEANTLVKDYLLSMGMNRLLYFLHHFIFHFMKAEVHVLVTSLIIGGIYGEMALVGYLFLLFSLFSATFMSIALLIGSLFKKPAIAIILSFCLWLGLLIADAGFVNVKQTSVLSLVASLSPIQATMQVLYAQKEATMREISDEGLGPQGYKHYCYLLILVFDGIFHFFLAVGIDWIRSSFENPLAFLRRGKMREVEDSKRLLEGYMEKSDPRGEVADILIEGVHKIYSSGEHAVRGVDMSMRKGQVTALLGHNGAGKSTTFSMISGMTVPTKGKITVMGKESNADKQKLIGFCPQYNPIFPKLTVDEHLEFFARLKGVQDWKGTSYLVLNCLGMSQVGHTRAITLSGGMKRKLCIAISLAANPPIVLLDEPTAGLDPGARRDFERLLMEFKKEHTILLTTHYTDEAEMLADRIFIMARGKVFCSGSSQFLRKKFDSGFILSFAVTNESQSEKASVEMANLVKEFVPDVSVCKLRGKQFELKLNTDDSKRFVEMFRKIEEVGPSFGMQSYGLSLTKLEQVFLKVGEMTGTVDRKQEVQTALKELIEENGNRAEGGAKIMLQILYTLLKRLQFDVTHIPSLILNLINIYFMAWGFMSISVAMSGTEKEKEMYTIYEIAYVMLLTSMIIFASPFMVVRPMAFLIIEKRSNYGHQERLTGVSRLVLLGSSILYDFLLFLLPFAAVMGGALTGDLAKATEDIGVIMMMCLVVFFGGELLVLNIYRVFATRAKGEISIIAIILGSGIATLVYSFIMILQNSASQGFLCSETMICKGYLGAGSLFPIYLFSPHVTASMWKRELGSQDSFGRFMCPVYLILYFAILIPLLLFIELKGFLKKKSCPAGEPGDDVVLRVNNLQKVYKNGKIAVNNITFAVRAHECFGVLGINGAGKSSTFEILTGNTLPNQGTASVNGIDCGRAPTIGYCPQADALIEHLTGRQSLVILAALHGYINPRKVADIVITCVGMQEHADRPTGRYSGGQRRKISVAASLLAQNSLIILDEPTAGIDPITRRDVWSVICALRENTNTAVVLTSHSMDEVEALVSNLIILREGAIVVEGSPQLIKDQYGGHYNFNLMPEAGTDVGEITTKVTAAFPGAILYDSASLKNIKYRIPRLPSDIFSTLFEKAAAIAEQIKVTDFSFTQATLEDAFMLASAVQPVMQPPPFGQPQHGQPNGLAPPPQGIPFAPPAAPPFAPAAPAAPAASAAPAAPATPAAPAAPAAAAPAPVEAGTETVTQTGAETGTTGV